MNMWKAVAVALPLALLAAQDVRAGGLKLSNVRSTYGFFGTSRPDAKYIPGDVIFLHFDIENLKTDPKTGAARWLMVMEVFDGKKAKPVFSKTVPNEMIPMLGGSRVPAFATIEMGTEQPPGSYT